MKNKILDLVNPALNKCAFYLLGMELISGRAFSELPSVFYKYPTPTLEGESEWQLPLLPQLRSVF